MDLCEICSQLTLSTEPSDRQHLGLYRDILQRSRSLGSDRDGCGGCAFFVDVLSNSRDWSRRLSELESMWVSFNDRRLDIQKPDKKHLPTYGTNDMQIDVCTAEGVSDPDPEIDCKRPVAVDPSDPKCFELAKSWIKDCAAHVGCAEAVPVRLPKRVIEIPADPTEAPKLVVTTDTDVGQYVVLSHFWGSLDIMKLTDQLLPQFQKDIPLEQLQRSFLDAITITRQLGFKYLWIDALCIIQDNAADWAEEMPKMALYYGRSALMIAATVAKDSSQGLLNDRHVPYSPIMGKEKKYCLRQKLLRWDWDIKHSVLASRGWAAQERMLAPRVLHYTVRQMIWECAEGFNFEASGIQDTVTGSRRKDKEYNKSKMQPFVTQGLKMTPNIQRSQQSSSSPLPTAEDSAARILEWQKCLDEFTMRDLTVKSDKLHAISGIASIISPEHELGTYLAGLWSKYLAIGLTWSRPLVLLTSPKNYRAPSWSWASLDGDTSSTALHSLPELFSPPDTPIWKKWRTMFELEFVESGIKLEDPRNPYGAVLEGSYIVVDGTCMSRSSFLELCTESSGHCVLGFDKSNAFDCPCCGASDPEDSDEQDERDPMGGYNGAWGPEFRPRRLPRDPSDAHFDLAMYVIAEDWFTSHGFVDLLLLAWVDEEKRVARRTGFARKSVDNWHKEDKTAYTEELMGKKWERMRLKLI